MSRGVYFHEQFAHVSHIGGIQRYRRHSDDFNQALQQMKVALAAKDDKPVKIDSIALSPTPSRGKPGKPSNNALLKNIQKKLKTQIIPEVLCRELDVLLQRFDERSKAAAILKLSPKTDQPLAEGEQEVPAPVPIVESTEEEKVKTIPINTPRIALTDSLMTGLHSTWNDLIDNAEENYKTWRTKAAEETWNRRVERKRNEQLNAEKNRHTLLNKQLSQPQKGSRASVTSLSNVVQPPLRSMSNVRLRPQHSLSRVSFLSTSVEHSRLLKPIRHGASDDSKAGLHVEFKLSTQTEDITKPATQPQPPSTDPKGVSFDVPKPMIDLYEDMIALIQLKCKRLLAEMKQKIIRTTGNIQHPKMCKVWFYEDIHHMRHKTNLLTINEVARKQKMKFVFSLLRKQIPENYNIDIEIPKAKHLCYIELIDGSSQVYYPSGRIAVLRFPPPNSSTLFFNDTDYPEEQLLGFITSTGCVLIMQPNLHARFVTDSLHERGFLCNGEIGTIEKQIRSHVNELGAQQPILQHQTSMHEDDEVYPSALESTVQLQLNSSMQLEYTNPTNIQFAFASHKEEFKFQLGIHPSQLPSAIEAATTSSSKKHSADKRRQSKSKLSTIISNSTNSSELSVNSEKPQIPIEKLLDGQVSLKDLPMMKELTILRKRIKLICNNWLKECRTPLGMTDTYTRPTIKLNQPRGAKSPRHVSMSSKRDSVNSEFLPPGEKEQLVRSNSARKSEPDVIESTMMEFLPHSDSGKMMKQKIYAKKNSSTVLPAIKPQATTGDNLLSRSVIPLDLPFACPNLIRQRLLQSGPVSTILYDTCTCRADQVPMIHDLEFDTFLGLTSHLNPRQLVVIGITNSNLRQIENEQTNELYEILQTLHYHSYSGRSQLCSCRLSINDDYRCLIYDLAQATKQSQSQGPLLIRRHHVQPGFVLIYQNGQLIFGDSIFNGYGTNVHDLKNQLNRMRQQHIALPEEFKFISDERRPNPTVLNSI